MDKNLVSALHEVIDDFGKDIIKEKRFVDIVNDYHPTMFVDNPIWKKVLTAAISTGFGKDLINCRNSDEAKLLVEKYIGLLSNGYGFDRKHVEVILVGLCYAMTIPVTLPVPKATGHKHNKKSTVPISSPNNRANKAKTKTPISIRIKRILYRILVVISLLFSTAGLFGSILMFGAYFTGEWWMSFTITGIGLIHLVTISMTFGGTINVIADDKKLRNWYEGAFAALLSVVLIIYMIPIIGFFMQLFEAEPYYEKITIITVVLSLFALSLVVAGMFAKDPPITLKDYKEKTFKHGLFTMCIILLLMTITPLIIYYSEISYYNTKNKYAKELSQDRKRQNKQIGFKDISLGEDWTKANRIIYTDSTWMWRSSSTKIDTTIYKGDIMRSAYLVDSVFTQPMMEAYTTFEGLRSLVRFYLIDRKVAAISVETNMAEDSIINIYSQKYGDPEINYSVPAFRPSLVDIFFDLKWWLYDIWHTDSQKQYQWTVGYNSIKYTSPKSTFVYYLSDSYFGFLKKKTEEKIRNDKRITDERHRQDSIKHENEMQEEIKARKREEDKAKEIRHRTMNDI